MLQILWNQIAYIGVRFAKDVSEHKYIILVNGLTIFSIFFNSILVVIGWFLIPSPWLLVGTAYSILLFITFFLNAKGNLFAARFYFAFLSFLFIVSYSFLEGSQANAHFYFLMIALTSFFSFPKRDKKWMKIMVIFGIIGFLGFEYFHTQIPPLVSVASDMLQTRSSFIHISFAVLLLFFSFYIHSTFQKAEGLALLEHQKSERLLQNILPVTVIKKLRDNPDLIAEKFDECTVLFSDIVGFTEMSRSMSATNLVSILDEIFSAFDDLAEKYQLEKIKTIGDAYMVVGGIPNPQPDHALRIARFALDVKESILDYQKKYNVELQVRIGINTGDVVAGVIGKKKFIYDLWGASVNAASRMESHGIPGEIQVSESTYLRLRENFTFSERGYLEVKGMGKVKSYILKEELHPLT